MTEQVSREQLVDELIATNEEAEYHAERAMLLEAELRECVNLLKNWWGGTYKSERILCIQQATETKLAEIAKANLL